MDRLTLMEAVENLLAANKYLKSSKTIEDYDDSSSDVDYAIRQLCRTLGLSMEHMERKA